jgi:hypothetical protein
MGKQVDTAEYLGMLRRMIVAGGARLAESDTDDLAAMMRLERYLALAIHRAVMGMRASGASWQDIGDAVGTSRQAAWQRWGGGRTAAAVSARPITQACRQLASPEPSADQSTGQALDA